MSDDRRVERGRATRQRLVSEAVELFGAQGFEQTSIEAVLEASGASRGSLYHHFANKRALFEAVVHEVESRAGDAIVTAAAAGGGDPAAGLKAGSVAWVRLASEPLVRRILLIDAPAALGWRRWREIEEQHGLGMIKAALQALVEEGRLPIELVDPFSHMLLAAVNELALLITLADDRLDTQAQAEAALDEFFNRLLPQTTAT
jgi:AcrR family transcriptional regulator